MSEIEEKKALHAAGGKPALQGKTHDQKPAKEGEQDERFQEGR